MFNLEESSVARHSNERCVRVYEDSDKRADAEIASVTTESVDAGDAQIDKNEIELDINDDSDDEDESGMQFPDTHVKLTSQMSHMSVESSMSRIAEEANDPDEEENAIILPVAQQAPRKNRVISKANKNNKKKQAQPVKVEVEEKNQQDNQKQKSGLKRGQRSKLKKIKEKYKDQDEEEKIMRMGILKSAGNKQNVVTKAATEEIEEDGVEQKEKRQQNPRQKSPQKSPKKQQQIKTEGDDEEQTAEPEADVEVEVEEEEAPAGDGGDLELLNSLTGLPHELDELLFALPVVAPYNALQNYK